MTKFKKDTVLFCGQVIKSYLNAHIDGYMRGHYNKESDTFVGWKSLLYDMMRELEYQLEIGQGQDQVYPYRIETINHFVNVKKHCIKLLIINSETECILMITILLERDLIAVKYDISVKVGFIVFEPVE